MLKHRDEISRQMVLMGVNSVPVIVISTAFAGFAVTGEISHHMMNSLHTVDMVPGFSGQFVFRELGIAIPALLMVSKVGAAIAAEIGTMKITEQIDALRLLQIDPYEYLVIPRVIAGTLMVACLTVIASFVTLIAAMFLARTNHHIGFAEYLSALSRFVTLTDLWCALAKGAVFGATIPLIACAFGFRCEPGADGVGRATTNAVVCATIAVIVLDFLLTFAFSQLLY